MNILVVLGAAVWKDGPSPTLRRRCAHAAALWARGGYDAVVVCGGAGQHPPTEAAMMKSLLTGAGVPQGCIHLEDRSTTTLENIAFAAEILTGLGCKRITLVTDLSHAPRAWLVAKALGWTATASTPGIKGGHLGTQLRQATREVAALPSYAVRLTIMALRGTLPRPSPRNQKDRDQG